MESLEAPVELYQLTVTVEEVRTNLDGNTFVTFANIGAKFWIINPTQLRSGDTVRLMFHKVSKDHALLSPAP